MNKALDELFKRVEMREGSATITGSQYTEYSANIVGQLEACIADAGAQVDRETAELVISATESALRLMSLYIFGAQV